jgi:tRNA acetyltransferase TAN1
LNNDKDNGNGEDPKFTAEQNEIEAELQAELANLRNPKRKDQIFRRLDFGSDMMAFLQTDDSDPLKLVLELFDNLAASGSGRSFRYLQRLTPVQQTCYANMNDIQSTIQGLVETHLPAVLRRMRNGDDIVGDEETSFSFSVLYRHRNNDQLNREELVRAVSVKLWQAYPKCTVDLKQPEVVVLLEVCKSICCCSIVSDYFRLKKFNLNAVFPATSDPTN